MIEFNDKKIHYRDFYFALDEVVTSFFNSIMIELKNMYVEEIENISIIGECTNLLSVHRLFKEKIDSNYVLASKIKKEVGGEDFPLEGIRALSIIKYYLENYKIDNSMRVLSKKLKDLLY